MSNLVYAGLAALTVGGGAAVWTVMPHNVDPVMVPDLPFAASNALDGRSFYIEATITGFDELQTDELVFENGMFHSTDCEETCPFGWSDYQTWQDGEVIHFVAFTECDAAPHSVVWYGTVTGDRLETEATWTTDRWYWTIQLNAEGAGEEIPAPTVEVPPLPGNV